MFTSHTYFSMWFVTPFTFFMLSHEANVYVIHQARTEHRWHFWGITQWRVMHLMNSCLVNLQTHNILELSESLLLMGNATSPTVSISNISYLDSFTQLQHVQVKHLSFQVKLINTILSIMWVSFLEILLNGGRVNMNCLKQMWENLLINKQSYFFTWVFIQLHFMFIGHSL